MKKLVLFAALLFSLPATAQSLKTDLNACAFKAPCVKKVHQLSNASTDSLYKSVLANNKGSQKQRLQTAHKQFVNYRRNFCKFSAYQSGKWNTVSQQVCETQLNIQYSTMLEGFLLSP